MIDLLSKTQAGNTTPSQDGKRVKAPDPDLRRPPTAGGPRRLPDPSLAVPLPRKKKMSKAIKGLLIGGGITGVGLGTSFLFF